MCCLGMAEIHTKRPPDNPKQVIGWIDQCMVFHTKLPIPAIQKQQELVNSWSFSKIHPISCLDSWNVIKLRFLSLLQENEPYL